MKVEPDGIKDNPEHIGLPEIGSPNSGVTISLRELMVFDGKLGMNNMDYKMLKDFFDLNTLIVKKLNPEELNKLDEVMDYLVSRDIQAAPCLIVRFQRIENKVEDIKKEIEKLVPGCNCLIGTNQTIIIITEIGMRDAIADGLNLMPDIVKSSFYVEEGLHIYNISKDTNNE